MAAIDIEKEFKHYLEIFTHDEELGKILAKVSFQELFNDKFLTENRSEEESYEYSTGSTGKTRGKEQ